MEVSYNWKLHFISAVNPMPQEMELLILYKVKMNKVIAVTGI
jgi:hypothetical protein